MHETKALPDASQTSVKIHQLDDHFHRSVGDRNQIEIDHTDRVEEIGRNEGISTEHGTYIRWQLRTCCARIKKK